MAIPEEFSDYIKPGTDRAAFIQDYLLRRGVETVLIPIEGKKHIYVKFPSSSYNAMFRLKTIIAHYDIVPDSPGANDNSSSDFAVMDFAVRLSKSRGVHNIRIFFTDGEEIGDGGVSGQGAYALAGLLKRLGITNEDVFVFDCMGRGTVPVLAKSILPPGTPLDFVKRFAALKRRAEDILRASARGGSVHGGDARWLTLPIPYSDNAGFLANGIPAVAYTMLPEDEANAYLYTLQKEKNMERLITNHTAENQAALMPKIPMTWRLLHTEGDNLYSLTPEAFDITAKILDEIARMIVTA